MINNGGNSEKGNEAEGISAKNLPKPDVQNGNFYGQNQYMQNPYAQNRHGQKRQYWRGQQNVPGWQNSNNRTENSGETFGQYSQHVQGRQYWQGQSTQFVPNPVYPVYGKMPLQFTDPEKYERKKSVKRLSAGIGLPLCIFLVSGTVIALIVMKYISRTFGQSVAQNLVSDPAFANLLNVAITLLLFTVPFLITSGMTGIKWRECVNFKVQKKGSVLPIVMLGMGICTLSNIASSLFSSIYEKIFNAPVHSTSPGNGTGLTAYLIALFCVAVFPALLEEFAMRGIILGSLRKKFSDSAAIFVSAAIFGLLHGNLQQIPFAFGVGLVCAYGVVYSGSLLPGIIIHFVNNAYAVTSGFLSQELSPMMQSVFGFLFYTVTLLIGLCGLIMLLKTDRNCFRLSPERSENTKENLGWFCSGAWIIVFFALVGLDVLVVQLL